MRFCFDMPEKEKLPNGRSNSQKSQLFQKNFRIFLNRYVFTRVSFSDGSVLLFRPCMAKGLSSHAVWAETQAYESLKFALNYLLRISQSIYGVYLIQNCVQSNQKLGPAADSQPGHRRGDSQSIFSDAKSLKSHKACHTLAQAETPDRSEMAVYGN